MAREFPSNDELAGKTRFVVVSPTATITKLTKKHGKNRGFLLKDIPGTSGRLDVICRSALACHLTAPKASVVLFGVLGSGKDAITLYFSSLVDNWDEVSLARVVKDLVQVYTGQQDELPPEYPQIALVSLNFEQLLHRLSQLGEIVYLTDKGEDIKITLLSQNITFVLGSHVDLGESEEEILIQLGAKTMSIGPRKYLTSHCIAYLNFLQYGR